MDRNCEPISLDSSRESGNCFRRPVRNGLPPPLNPARGGTERRALGGASLEDSFSFVARINDIASKRAPKADFLAAPEKARCADLRGISLGAIFGFIDNLLHPRFTDVNISNDAPRGSSECRRIQIIQAVASPNFRRCGLRRGGFRFSCGLRCVERTAMLWAGLAHPRGLRFDFAFGRLRE